ncbi:hypothetical protein D9619_000933 [Psilocybe cf. subviscida]|uniref:chitin deacetylase n=1 Tax=Psilocybe cf. subviscida TaxID=2480587 RepID=A0A8H5F225_9AGAR|nr:hypothetical protein D9619_000933 [Psilocybe cf. subviscida]
MFFALFVCALQVASILASPTPTTPHDHAHNVQRGLPATWYQERDHPVHNLFRRATNDGANYPAVGSPAWSAPFPTWSPDPRALPAEWVNALNAAVSAGKIPNNPIPTNTPNTNPIYPAGTNPNGPEVCSATYKCRAPGDIWDAPEGVFASSFDDGPSEFTPGLVDFLKAHNETTTHFMIGVHILGSPNQFKYAFEADHDIAVHTWTHPYMTTLSNLDVVGQLGWTMQLIHHSTGGRVPKYWRPPYGDADMRVRAIASEVFGLQTVIWNNDTFDWEATPEAIQASMQKFLTGPKRPGLVVLEHEIKQNTVTGFLNSHPMIAANGWKFISLAKAINDGRTYQNAGGSLSDDVKASNVLAGADPNIGGSSSSGSSSSSSSAPTATQTSPVTTPSASPATNLPASSPPPSPTPTSSAAALSVGWLLPTSLFLAFASLILS